MLHKIGDFARLCQISVRTLRFYEQQGLLRPSRVDPESGYRFYETDLLPRIHRILALRDLGLSLDEIRAVLGFGRMGAAELRRLLSTKRAALEEQVAQERARLSRVEARLRFIETEEVMPEYEVVLKSTPAVQVAGIREIIPDMEHLSERLGANFRTVCQHVGSAASGPAFEIWHSQKAFTGKDMDVECCQPFDGTVPGKGDITVRTLPAIETMACAIHKGPYDKLGDAHNAIHHWMESNGYKFAGPDRCVYYEHHRNGDPNDNVAEIQYPVEKAG